MTSSPMLRARVWFLALIPLASLPAARAESISALRYDGGDYAYVPHNPVFSQIEATDVVTIEAWIRISGYPQGWFPIVDKYRSATNFGWTFQIWGGNNNVPANIQFVGGIGPTAEVQWTPTLNQWTHVAVSYDRSEGVIRFFTDGALLAALAYSADIQGTGTTDPLYIGYGPSGATEYAQGDIDELRLWNRALTPAEIAADYNRSLTGAEPGLVGYWRFEEGSGTTFVDSSPSGHGGALGPAPRTPTWISPGAPLEAAAVPGPSGLVLLGLGAVGLAGHVRRRRYCRGSWVCE